MLFLILIFIAWLSSPLFLFSMHFEVMVPGSTKRYTKLPDDLAAKILAIPNFKRLKKIISIQEEINQQQKTYPHGSSKPIQPSLLTIQSAIFPCFELTRTCKMYNEMAFKQKVVTMSLEILESIFPQGIALFLLPDPIQLRAHREYCFDDCHFFYEMSRIYYYSNKNLIQAIPNNSPETLEKAEYLLKSQGFTISNGILYDPSKKAIAQLSGKKLVPVLNG